MNPKRNPYASPCEVSAPIYDRTILKRCLWFGLWFACVVALINAGIIWQHFDQLWAPGEFSWGAVYSFMCDWRGGPSG